MIHEEVFKALLNGETLVNNKGEEISLKNGNLTNRYLLEEHWLLNDLKIKDSTEY